MPTFGKLDKYNKTEDWPHYIERVNHSFEANEITHPGKRRSIFLVYVGAEPINLCEVWLPEKIQMIKYSLPVSLFESDLRCAGDIFCC